MLSRRPWTDDELALLAKLLGEQRPVVEIALALDRTPGAVINRAQELGLRFAPGQRGTLAPPAPRGTSRFQRIF